MSAFENTSRHSLKLFVVHLILLVWLSLPLPSSGAPVSSEVPVCGGIHYGMAIDSAAVKQALADAGECFLREGRAIQMSTLTNQLQRTSCALKLPNPAKTKLQPQPLAKLTQRSVLVVAGVYRCETCNQLHSSPSAGFVITKGGAFVTSCHVLSHHDYLTVLAMTGDGKIYPVKEILAADADTDVAIGQLDGSGFAPLPLSRDASPGMRVLVNSHPHEHFFSLSEGIVARHFVETENGKQLPVMAVTADFGPGSSGAPVIDPTGASVGVVDSIVYRRPGEGEASVTNPAFIFKHCRPASAVLDLIRSK